MRYSFGGFSTPFMSRILLDTGAGEGGGSGGGTEKNDPPKPLTVEDVVKKHGTADAAMLWLVSKNSDLEKDNFNQRNELRASKAREPASGARVLTADEAAELDKYRSLGKPEILTASLKERDELSKRIAQVDREREITEVAEAEKWNPKVLLRSVRDEKFVKVEAKDKNGNTIKGEDDKPKQIWAVQGADEKSPPVPVHEHFADFLPSLAPVKEEDKNTPSPSREFRRADSSVPSGTEKPTRPLFF